MSVVGGHAVPKLKWPKRPVEARKTRVRFLGVPLVLTSQHIGVRFELLRRCRCEGDEILR